MPVADVLLDDPIVLALRQATAGDYDIISELGRGGMAVVYLAHDLALGRKVAIKVMFPSLLREEGTAERFKREARTAASLTHPGIIPIHSVREHGSLLFIVMQFVKGRTLDSILTEKGPLPIPMVQTILHQVGAALDYAHRRGVVHRDIKPGNILLDEEGRVVVTDFGIAKVVSSDSLTRTGGVVGTPSYMSPEQCTAGTVTGASDQYALGMVAYEMLTGQLPLRGDNPMQTMYLRVTQDAPPISALRPDCPPEIESAVLRMLAREPAGRWPDFSRALGAIGVPPATPVAETRWTLTRRFDRRIPVTAAAVVALLVAVLAIVRPDSNPAFDQLPGPGSYDLAILPFEEGDSAALGRSLARYTSLRLEWNPRWNLMPVRQSFERWDAERLGDADAISSMGSMYTARGTIVFRDSSPTLVLSIDSAGRPLDQVTVPGGADPLEWSRAISDSVVSRLFTMYAAEFHDLNRKASMEPRAVRAVLAGNEAFQLDNMAAAAGYYEEALRLDPGFAQAAWQLMLVRRWEREDFEGGLRRLYEEQGDALPPAYLALTRAQLEPDLRRRFALYDSITSSFPAHGMTHFLATSELFHRGPLVGIPLRHAVELMVQGSRDHPDLDQASTYDQTVWGYIRLGDREGAADQLARRARRTASAGDEASESREDFLNLAFDARFRPARAALKETYLRWFADSATLAGVAQYVRFGLFVDIPRMQEGLGGMLIARDQPAARRAQGYTSQALALLMQGRVGEGLSRFDSAVALSDAPEMRLQQAAWRLVPAVLGFPDRPADEASRARERLVAFTRDSILGPRAAWSLAMDAEHRGDTAGAARWHVVVHGAAVRGDLTASRLDLILHARSAAGSGQLDSALALTEPLFVTDSAGRIGGPFARTAMYLDRGKWHQQLGHLAAADSAWLWYENSDFAGWPTGAPQAGEVDAVFSTRARLLRARNQMALGGTANACDLVGRVRELWRDADAPLRGAVDSAWVEGKCG